MTAAETFRDMFACHPARLLFNPSSLQTEGGTGKRKPKYRIENGAPAIDDFERHLSGAVSLGLSPLCNGDTVRWGVIDVDLYGDAETEVELQKALRGMHCVVFRSKSNGYHVYVLVDEPTPAADMVDVLSALRSKFPKRLRGHAKEIFPKQTSLKDVDKQPSMVNLPLFGADRGLAFIMIGAEVIRAVEHLNDAEAILTTIKEKASYEPEKWAVLVERASKARKTRPIHASKNFREPDNPVGRNDYLLRVGASLRARGGDAADVRETLTEVNTTRGEERDGIWADGPLPMSEVEAITKSVLKFEQGSPSGLTYQKVAEFNEKYAVLNVGGKVEVLNKTTPDFSTWPWGEFVKWVKTERAAVGNKYLEIAPLWLMDVDRAEYDGIVIEPANYRGKGYNVFRGFAVDPLEGDASLFIDAYVREILCAGDEAAAEWILDYFADMVQRPTEPSPPTAIALRGRQGQGKSFLFHFMKAIMGRSAVEVADAADRLFTRFNRHLLGVTLIGAEEAIFSGDPRLAQILKTFISSPRWTYEEKYRGTVEAKNVHRLIATTNSEHAVKIDNDDRRWTILDVPMRWDISTPEGKAQASKDWEPFYAFMRCDGPAIVLDALLRREVDHDRIRFGHINVAKAQDKIQSDPILAVLDEIAETGVLPHDLKASGIVSIQSLADAVRAAGGRWASQKNEEIRAAVASMLGLGKEHSCRTAVYVERTHVDSDGIMRSITKKRQRGFDMGPLSAFRGKVSRITLKQYEGDDDWGRWVMHSTMGSGEDLAELQANMDRYMARVGDTF